MAVLRARRVVVLVTVGACLGAAGTLVWMLGRRLPVEQAREFLTAPLEVGDEPPAGPSDSPPAAEIERRYGAAQTAFRAGRYGEAATEFSWVVSHDPAGPWAGRAQWSLTRSRLRDGDATGAVAAFDHLVGHYAAFLGEQAPALREGLERMEQGDFPAAQAALERMLREQPESEFVPVAHALTARIHWVHGEPMKMVRAFARMFASVRDPVLAYADLAHHLERYARGDAGVTETFGRLAREGDEGFRDVYQYLAARSLLERGRFDSARDTLEELRRRYPEGDFTHIVDLEHAWNLLRNGQAAEALAIFERLEGAAPPLRAEAFDRFFDLRAELPMGIARCHLALGQYAQAAAAFERALTEHPRSLYRVENQLGLARAYEGMGRLDESAAVLRRVIAEHPDEPKIGAVRQQLARVEARSHAEP